MERLLIKQALRLNVVRFSFSPTGSDGICPLPRPALSANKPRQKKFLLQMIHAAPIKSVGLGVLADGQTIHKLLLKIILVLNQHRFQGIVQKLQVFFQLGEIVSGDGGGPLFFHAEAVFVPVKVLVLTQIFRVC